MKLSILVCSLSDRLKEFSVIEELCAQAEPFDDVEVLWLGDNQRIKVGTKRNMLMSLASGRYVVCVDDDDEVAGDYVDLIRRAADRGSDVICFDALYSKDGKASGSVDYSMKYERDGSQHVNGGLTQFLRLPNHICAISRELAAVTRFDEAVTHGSDADFAKRLKPLLKTETKIDKCLYFYNWTSAHSMTG